MLENSQKPEWGGWKFVSEMLDNPEPTGMYQTTKCYRKLYEFVVEQKAQARAEERARLAKVLEGMKIHKGNNCNVIDCERYNQAVSEAIKVIKKEEGK